MAGSDVVRPEVPSSPRSSDDEDLPVKITIKFTPENHTDTLSFAADATIDELTVHCDELWPDYDWSQAKIMLSSRVPAGSAKPPKTLLRASDDGETPLSPYHSTTLKLLAQKRSAISALQDESAAAATRARVLAARKARGRRGPHATSRRRNNFTQDDAAYTFHTVRPLPYLPRPERSLALLERLKDDAGIRAAMRQHKFSVGLLTEMDPAAYTDSNHEGTTRILGLNRNAGEVIELRLRTDAGDGYRDYKTIRKTLCHELAHNVHGPHDKNFWDLCRQIEREVAAGDWRSGGRTVADDREFARVNEQLDLEEEDEEVTDHGAWTGGSYVLGGGSGSVAGAEPQRPMDRREVLARAAEARMRNMANANASKDRSTTGNDSGNGQGSA